MSVKDKLLAEAAQLFRHYETLHRAKGPGHEEKVARNADIASRIEAALKDEPGAPSCDTCDDRGEICVGTSGLESDGNAAVMERCPDCGYADAGRAA